jgi:hypothetical protein
MPTSMTILKCPEHSCLRIYCIDNIKIDINWICTRLKLTFQPETNEHRTKTRQQIIRTKTGQHNTPHKDETTKQTNMWKLHLFIITLNNYVFVKIFVEDVLKGPRKDGVDEVVIIIVTNFLLLLSWSWRVHCVFFLSKNLKRFWSELTK